jgi:hypothetical protein
MTWLTLSYFIMVGTIAQDHVISNGVLAWYTTPPNTFETTLGAELVFAEHFFAGGSVETYMHPYQSVFFNPTESDYKFSFGIRYAGFEIGWRHECDHMTLSYADFGDISRNGGYTMVSTEFYLSFKGSMKIF